MEVRPGVSVVMAVWNGQSDMAGAVNSILSQAYGDFEFIIVDDGSTDMTPRLLDEYATADPRVQVFHRPHQGQADALNFGVSHARAELIARMDADDVSLPGRLELQASYMHSHPEIGLLGSATLLIDESGADRGTLVHPSDHFEIREAMIRSSQFSHSAVMFRKSTFDSLGGYGDMPYAQDYDLWLRMATVARIANLRQPLVLQRMPRRRAGGRLEQERLRMAWRARMNAIERGDYPRTALLRLVGPAVAASLPASVRSVARHILHPRAA